MSDVVFVAIDFENAQSIWENTSSKMGCQVGIAILDTRKIERRRLAATSLYLDNELDESPSKGAEELITTYNFAGGPVEYCQRAKVKSSFLFGKTIFIDQSDMRQKIESCLPQERDIILDETSHFKQYDTLVQHNTPEIPSHVIFACKLADRSAKPCKMCTYNYPTT